MIGNHIQEALVQVRQLQQTVLERLRFKGYSGTTRSISGTMALVAAFLMSLNIFPAKTEAHLVGWGCVFVVSLILNAGALLYWFWTDPIVSKNVNRLGPVLDVIPPLFVAAIMTVALILHGMHDYLFGVWMCMFGLTNLASRHVLPRAICVIGLFYVACGAAWLLAPNAQFLNPWPMGMVFFAGEWAGGLILHLDHRRLEFVEEKSRILEEASHE
ncbi:MAG: hypothetical protein AAF492_21690 [Verrucomicrobiota bacterium]